MFKKIMYFISFIVLFGGINIIAKAEDTDTPNWKYVGEWAGEIIEDDDYNNP